MAKPPPEKSDQPVLLAPEATLKRPGLDRISRIEHLQQPLYVPPDWIWIRRALDKIGNVLFKGEWSENDLDAVSLPLLRTPATESRIH